MDDAAPDQEPITKRPKLDSAAIAGVVYALCATAALLLIDTVPFRATETEWSDWIADGDNRFKLNLALYLASLSAVTFLWFVAVIRRRLGSREDKFFSTVFLGSALIYVGLWLVTVAVLAAPAVLHSLDPATTITFDTYQLAEGSAGGLLLVAGPRIQAVFIASTSIVFLRTGIVPRWLAYLGFAVAIVMFVIPIVVTPVGLGLPVFVLITSLTVLLIRHRPETSLG